MLFSKKLLFIGASSSFIANAIKDGLKEVGFDCSFCRLSVDEISKIKEVPPIIMIYVDEKAVFETEALIYVRDLCMDDDRIVYLIGYADEVEEVKKIFPSNALGGSFERPINIRQIAETLKDTAKDSDFERMKKHILLVDDSGTMLRTIKSWLEDKYRISMANSATAAISFLAVNKPDLVLLDYEMPICSGPQMLEMIRSEIKTESIPVIFLTSRGDKESVERVLSLRPQGYLLKTMSAKDIVTAIDNFFNNQKMKEL